MTAKFFPLPDPDGSRAKNFKVVSFGNQGLLYNKFFNAWPVGGGKLETEAKGEWIKEFCKKTRDSSTLEKANNRTEKLVKNLGGHIEKLEQVSPLVTGMGLNHPIENGFLWHHTLGVPYIPGSSVKGMVRSWAEHWEGAQESLIIRLFGGTEKSPSAGNIIFFDALPLYPVELVAEVMTPHDGGWRMKDNGDTEGNSNTTERIVAPSDWNSPVPIPFLAVKEGSSFQFAFAPRKGADEGDIELATEYIVQALKYVGIGAKTAIGMGRFLRQEELLAAIEEANQWQPTTGEKVLWPDVGEEVLVIAVQENVATVRFTDNEEDVVSLDALQRIK